MSKEDIQVNNGDCVEVNAGELVTMVCCKCGMVHKILFNRDTTMQIWDEHGPVRVPPSGDVIL